MSERPSKRPRGSYAKLICLHCRERRIKCQIPDDATIEPSASPQPPEKACERCRQRGLDCIVRKTTLGRPTSKQKAAARIGTGADTVRADSPSLSPETDDLVLLSLDNEDEALAGTLTPSNVGIRPTNVQLMKAISNNFDLTSGLLARDPRFGSAIVESIPSPRPLESLVDRDLAQLLDQHLVWLRLYIPWLPPLIALSDEINQSRAEPCPSTRLLLALLISIALDVPSKLISAEQRLLQSDLRSIIKQVGQEVLFTLPRHPHTVTSLVLVHSFRPLSLVDSQQAAAHTLNGTLYPTLVSAVQRQLNVDTSSQRLTQYLEEKQSGDAEQLIVDATQWCSSLVFQLECEMDAAKARHAALEAEFEQTFTAIATAIDRGLTTISLFFTVYAVRCHADCQLAFRRLTHNWNDLTRLASIINNFDALCDTRKTEFAHKLESLFCRHGRTEEMFAIMQIMEMEINHSRTRVVGLALFFAIVSAARNSSTATFRGQTIQLHKYYTSAVEEIGLTNQDDNDDSDILQFLDKYGDQHLDGLEKRLTDFINIASEAQLGGMPFYGPPRHVTGNVLMACKEIVENNAVRIRLDGKLHPRFDMQMVLVQEAARCLEAMEVDGGTADAIRRGSVFTAAAKLIRSLHRIMSQWKRMDMAKQRPVAEDQSSGSKDSALSTAGSHQNATVPETSFEPSGLFQDDFFVDWDNWPQLNTAGLAYNLPFDFDSNTL